MSSAAETSAVFAPSQAECLRGDFRALFRQVGSHGFLPEPLDPFWSLATGMPPALAPFLEGYFTRLLLPFELPAIVEACGHARHSQLRELLVQDNRLAAPLLPTPFATPSRRMGRLHLARLRPLRDHRLVQRYLAAVESGRAHGWHTVVYGITLAVYSLPMRQGLLYYAQQTLSALASAAGRSRSIGQSDLDPILSAVFARLPRAVESAIPAPDLNPES